ncbi:MAG TPA: maleylacetoacetate isomerase [Rhizomicrobium sp.]|nr:maleylacetoacetate isomerase [Rhizomicrobium sp.]
MTLYTYFRSSAAWRARIALNLKGLKPDYCFIHLLKDDQHSADYQHVNPQQLIPALVDDKHIIAQSLAIIEYLDETYPEPPLLPKDAAGRARVRQIAYAIACDIHPINNLRVLHYLRDEFQVTDEQRTQWQRHWIAKGFDAIEKLLAQSDKPGRYCHGNTPTLADICLIPQMGNARRVHVELTAFPILLRIEETALAHPAFSAARPEVQPDAQ